MFVLARESSEGLVAHGEKNDGEERRNETWCGADVPLAKDDAEVVGVPGEEHLRGGSVLAARYSARERNARRHQGSFAYAHAAHVVHAAVAAVAAVVHIAVSHGGVIMTGVVHGGIREWGRSEELGRDGGVRGER